MSGSIHAGAFLFVLLILTTGLEGGADEKKMEDERMRVQEEEKLE